MIRVRQAGIDIKKGKGKTTFSSKTGAFSTPVLQPEIRHDIGPTFKLLFGRYWVITTSQFESAFFQNKG
jgi:hypothetical protein